ncbi:MAG: metal-sensing transcriptional repressor [Tenericutes bacterium]|nr:metal-sensing transcriptional repressor [Mycoplasmatota bacterium]
MNCDISLKNRIKRAKGQMQGILNMMDSNESCKDILTQLKAVRSSVDTAIGILTTNNLIQLIEENNSIVINDVDDAIKLIVKGLN